MRDIFFHNLCSTLPKENLQRMKFDFKKAKIMHQEPARLDVEIQATPSKPYCYIENNSIRRTAGKSVMRGPVFRKTVYEWKRQSVEDIYVGNRTLPEVRRNRTPVGIRKVRREGELDALRLNHFMHTGLREELKEAHKEPKPSELRIESRKVRIDTFYNKPLKRTDTTGRIPIGHLTTRSESTLKHPLTRKRRIIPLAKHSATPSLRGGFRNYEDHLAGFYEFTMAHDGGFHGKYKVES